MYSSSLLSPDVFGEGDSYPETLGDMRLLFVKKRTALLSACNSSLTFFTAVEV